MPGHWRGIQDIALGADKLSGVFKPPDHLTGLHNPPFRRPGMHVSESRVQMERSSKGPLPPHPLPEDVNDGASRCLNWLLARDLEMYVTGDHHKESAGI